MPRHSPPSSRATLSGEQIAFYRENGHLFLENVVPLELLIEIRAVTRALVERAAAIDKSDALFDIGPGHSRERSVVRRIKNPTRHHEAYDRLMRSPCIVDVVADLLGPGVRFDHSKLNFKPRTGAAAVEWHQDWAFYPHTNDDILALGVLLEDATEDNGAMMVIPGSHRGPVFDHHFAGHFVGAIDPAASGLDAHDAVALTGRAGSITIHHVRTVHGSRENRTSGDRPLLIFSYLALDAWPIAKSHDWEEFQSRILRGAPDTHPRQEALPVRLPFPRLAHIDSIYDDQDEVRGRSFGAAARGPR